MDIWQWVHDIDPELRRGGHARLAELIKRLPAATVDEQHERVDALAPEALALARAAGLPWVEVFVRHWHLQSRVLHRSHGDMALGEAVALVEYAHSEPARGCPQAVCTVQDLAACYSQVDGPGYGPERAAVARETLARIDPTWPCFTCISCELSGALREGGDPQAALDLLDAQLAQLVAAGRGRERTTLLPERIACLLALGRVDEALLACDDAIANGRRDEGQRRSRRIDLARIYARLGRGADSLRELPVPEDILPTPGHYEAYTDALVQQVRLGVRANDGALGRLLQRFVTRLEAGGSRRQPFLIAAAAAELAIARGSLAVAGLHLAAMQRLAPRLHRPHDAPAVLARVRMSLETGQARTLRDPPTDPEDVLLVVVSERAAAPGQPGLACRHARALLDLGFGAEAADLLEAHLAADPDDEPALGLLERAYRSCGDDRRHQALGERLLADASASKRRLGRWVAARRLAGLRDHAGSNAHLEVLAEIPADAVEARLLHASNAREQRDWPAVLRLLDEVLALQPDREPGAFDWDRMIAATFLGAWDRLRDSARRVGLTLEGDSGPVSERRELCRIRLEHPNGRRQELFAARTGPVTARLLQISRVDQPQRVFDTVVFDPRPLGELEGGDSGSAPVLRYAEIGPLVRAQYRAFSVDGVHPGGPVLAGLRELAQRHQGSLQAQSGAGYRVTAPDGDTHPGLYAILALAPDTDLRAVCDELVAHTRELSHPLVWPELAAAAGDDALAERHRQLAGDWSL